ncbi:MAG: AMP-binding protein, partial [Actinomadura sp.]
MRESSVPALVDLPDSINLTDAPFTRAAEQPERVAFRRPEGSAWRSVTAAEFRDDVVRIAKGLIAAGVEPGDRVALLSRTRYEWTLIDYAVWAAGGVTVPIYETSSAEQIEWIISDSGAKAAFAESESHVAKVEGVRAKVPALAHVWGIDGGALDAFAAQGEGVADEVFEERRRTREAADLATLVYTSGTTGRPKGCELTHGNFVVLAQNATEGALKEILVRDDASTLLFLPLAHVFARFIQVMCVEAGVILGHSPDLTNLVADLGSYRPTFLLAVPRVFEKVYNGA